MSLKNGTEIRDRKLNFELTTVSKSEMEYVKARKNENTDQVIRLISRAMSLSKDEVNKIECQNILEARILYNRIAWQIKHKSFHAGISRHEKSIYVYPVEA